MLAITLRVRDACSWTGGMPYGLAFQDMPDELPRKLGCKPEREVPRDLESLTTWALGEHRVVVTFDLIVNLISSITAKNNAGE